MARTHARDNPVEKALRSALFRSGLRYRIHYPVPGRPRRTIDVAFPSRKLAVFIDGCFWHGCPEHGTWPTRNGPFWREKIQANRARDLQTDSSLRALGWRVLRFWEHDSDEKCVRQILRALKNPVDRKNLRGLRRDPAPK
jgi:DNA mismatch endonuclease (patch repair protein)